MKTRALPLFVLTALFASVAPLRAASASNVKLTKSDDRVRVEVGGKLFTEFIFKGAPKPYLYPVLATDGTGMTRNFPMKKGVPGEVEDHPHHRSLYFTHGDVNGLDFWAESNSAKQGKIVTDKVDLSGKDTIVAQNRWVGPDGTVHLTDETKMRFGGTADARYIDFEVKLKAPADKEVVFRDTKEGSMAIRLPLWMTPSHRSGKKKHEGKGTIVNDAGVKNTPTWGKKSKWVDYYAPKDGKVYGVAIFDHPSNPRHPTWWHVRDYGLFAANPWGKHDFENLKDQPRAGDMKIAAGKSETFRWRFYFHQGDENAAKIAERYKEYAAGK